MDVGGRRSTVCQQSILTRGIFQPLSTADAFAEGPLNIETPGLAPETRDDHAAYIASWLKVLKDDKRAIFTAASHAQKAADFLRGLQPQTAAMQDEDRQRRPHKD